MIVDAKKRKRKFTNEDKASLDIWCNSDRIGVIVNLSQELNSIMWDKINRSGDWIGAKQAYYDNCLLSILASIAIDSTKKEYPIDCDQEFKIVRERYNDKDKDGKAIRPYFFAHVAKKKGYYDPNKKNYKRHMAPMDYVQDIVDGHRQKRKNRGVTKNKISDIIKDIDVNQKPRYGYVELVLAMVRDMDANTRMLYNIQDGNTIAGEERHRLTNLYFQKCICGIKNMKLNDATMRELLVLADSPENSSIRRKLWSIIFGSLGREFASLIKKSQKPIYTLEECKHGEAGDIQLYWLQFKKKQVNNHVC